MSEEARLHTTSTTPTSAHTPEPTSSKHLGRGAEAIATALAQMSGKSPDEILALRAHGHGFGRIARDLGIDMRAAHARRAATTPDATPAAPAAAASVDTLI